VTDDGVAFLVFFGVAFSPFWIALIVGLLRKLP